MLFLCARCAFRNGTLASDPRGYTLASSQLASLTGRIESSKVNEPGTYGFHLCRTKSESHYNIILSGLKRAAILKTFDWSQRCDEAYYQIKSTLQKLQSSEIL